MAQQTLYPTGSDTEVYYTRAPTLGASAVDSALADFEERDPLDISGVVYMEEGQAVPLFDFAQRISEHKIHTRRMVSGSLEFNVSEKHMRRHRTPGLQNMNGGSIWIVQNRIEYRPEPTVERDVIRISGVYERPFRHSHEPHAKESVPFIGRNAILVRRQFREIDTGTLAEFSEESASFTVDGDDIIADEIDELVATVTEVADGDTYTVVPTQTGEEIDVRLAGADTPETFKEDGFGSKNRDDMADWSWSGAENSSRGTPGESPSKEQLDDWGSYIGDEVRARLKGETVLLRRNPGASSTDAFGRYLFRVSHAGTDIATRLLQSGYAKPTAGLAAGIENGGYINRREKLVRHYREAKQKAGQDDAKGIWYSFDPGPWDTDRSFSF